MCSSLRVKQKKNNDQMMTGKKTDMKQLLILLFMLPYALWGQSHISVFDQEMGVDIVDFVKQLQSKGYVFVESNQAYGTESDCVYMNGSFLGFDNCRIVILQNKELKAVSVVNIKFRTKEFNENTLTEMVKELDKRHGKSEYYQSQYDPDSRSWKWNVLGSEVSLNVEKNGMRYDEDFFGQLHYADVAFVKLLQEKAEAKMKSHIKFMGHYISEPSFVKNLQHDLKIWKDSDGNYRGEVGGYESLIEFIPYDFSINIAAIKITKPKYERWVDLKRTYQTYKELFSKKYSLIRSNENTGIRYGSSLSESDFALRNIMIGDGNYSCAYEIPGGMIMMSIEPKKGSEYPEYGEVVIYYIDNQNYEEIQSKEEKEKLDDL